MVMATTCGWKVTERVLENRVTGANKEVAEAVDQIRKEEGTLGNKKKKATAAFPRRST